MREPLFKGYTATLGLSVAALLAGALLLNSVVDPLWYFRGNLITGENFSFNERLSKMNRFLDAPVRYDCFIFGSSRTALLDAKAIEGYNCFNFAFSAGLIGEYLAYASYLRERGHRPRLVIVGIDDFNFSTRKLRKTVPDFVQNGAPPPNFLVNYLSLDALRFSLQALRGASPGDIHYRPDFSAFAPCKGPYQPLAKQARGGELKADASRKAYAENAAWYAKLMNVFPRARFVFYVPPVSVWKLDALEAEGRLEGYLQGVYAVSRMAPVLYDFAAPSAITRDASRTCDGSHYDDAVNQLIVETINSGHIRFGVNVKDVSYSAYQARYRGALTAASPVHPARPVPSHGSSAGEISQLVARSLKKTFELR
ncbi:MAG: hypothetical protein ACREVE_00125 [Gammaproteobacteria bacterium]